MSCRAGIAVPAHTLRGWVAQRMGGPRRLPNPLGHAPNGDFQKLFFTTSVFPGSPLRNLPFLFNPHPRGRFRIGLPGFRPFCPFAENSGRKIRDITRGFNKFRYLSFFEDFLRSRIVTLLRQFHCVFRVENSHNFGTLEICEHRCAPP